MNVFGSASAVPARQFIATTRTEAKGLDQLVKDPASALRHLGEQSLTTKTQSADRNEHAPAISTATDRSLTGALVRQAIDEARGGLEKPAENGAAKNEAADGLKEAREKFAGGNTANGVNAAADEAAAGATEKHGLGQLSKEEQAAVQEMKARDREVRAHEQAHKNVGGRHAGAISFSYQKGPDGQQYAVGGGVPIDMSPEASPEATIAKMRVVIAAALAPADPSGPDRAIAQAAQGQLIQATAGARAERQAEAEELREGKAEEEGGRPELSEAGDRAPDASAVAGLLAVGAPDSPYTALGVVDFNALGERHEKSAAA